MFMRRVVVTGMGAVSPFGIGVDVLWNSLLKNKNGISKISNINVTGDIVQIAGMLPRIDVEDYKFTSMRIPEDDDIKVFFKAIVEALNQAGIDPHKMNSTDRFGSFIADRRLGAITYLDQFAGPIKDSVENGCFNEEKFYRIIEKSKIGKESYFDDWESINHFFARNYNITGPQLSIATACASGNSAIGEAFFKIRNGYLDMALAGGAYNYDLSAMVGFTRIGALTLNPDPEIASCPFDLKRSGFVMGSGCGVLMLEDLELAKRRGARILCEITGYGYCSDSYRITDPDPEAKGSTNAIKSCLNFAKLNPEEVNYISAHGTSTKMNDLSETIAIKNAFGDYAYKVCISSTKSMIGHSIMAAAAIEAIVCIKSINEGVIHPTRNLVDRDPLLDLDYVSDGPREIKVQNALSNSFGFGGQNVSILFSKLER
jgi:3-oxoacyl-[acyl-carrier-protein] synthase II